MRSNYGAHSTFDVPGSGGAKLNAWHVATELALPAKYCENASFAHNYCVYRPILIVVTALESACLVPKLVKSSRYHITYVARGSAAKKLRYIFDFWWLKALAERGNAEYRANLIGCKCGIAPKVRIFFYYNKIISSSRVFISSRGYF